MPTLQTFKIRLLTGKISFKNDQMSGQLTQDPQLAKNFGESVL